MTKLEAIKAMCDGKRVTRAYWGGGDYIYMSCNSHEIMDQDQEPVNINSFLSGGWEIYKEPKPKKILKEWMYEDEDGNWIIDKVLRTKEEVNSCYSMWINYKPTGREW